MVLAIRPQKKRSVGLKQEHSKSNPRRDTLQRDIREWTNSAEKGQCHSQAQRERERERQRQRQEKTSRKKGTTTRDQAGSPDEETGQRRLDDFWYKKSEPRVDRAA